jgi:hypothetical protein
VLSGVNFLYEGLREQHLIQRRECTIVGVYADTETLYDRYGRRNCHQGDNMLSRDAFDLILAREQEGVAQLLGIANTIIINNSTELNDLEISVRVTFSQTLGYRESGNENHLK